MLDTELLLGAGPGSGGAAGDGDEAGAGRAAAAGDPVLVLMHGRGADRADLAPLRRWFPDDVAIVLARAPFEAARWGYGPGWAWYLYEGEDRPEAESFRRSQAELESLVAGLGEVMGVPPGPVFLGGFSQGGTMSLGYALRRPTDIAGVLNFSGFVPDHPDVPGSGRAPSPPPAGPARRPATAPPVFWGHGTMDPAIPFAMAVRGRQRLRNAGVPLEARDYPMGHGISPEELKDARSWLEGVLGR